MSIVDLESHPELRPLVAAMGGQDDGVVVICSQGRPVAYLERAKPADLFAVRRTMTSPVASENAVVEMRREDGR